MCIFIFVCTSVELLPPGESPIAVNDDDDDDDDDDDNNNNNNNNNRISLACARLGQVLIYQCSGKAICTGIDRPGGLQAFEASWIVRQSAHEGCKLVSPTHRPPFVPVKMNWHSFLLEAESTPGPQCDRKD